MRVYRHGINRRQFVSGAAKGCLLAATLGFPVSGLASDPLQVRYYHHGFSLALRQYFNDVVTMVLETTVDGFGPFQLHASDKRLAPIRTMLEVQRGEILHLAFGSSWYRNVLTEGTFHEFEYPFVFDLIGLRRYITAPGRAKALARVGKVEELKEFSVGQGEGWPDTMILQRNGFRVVEGYELDSLVPMLAKGRFDLLPLSILETSATLAEYRGQHKNLAINNDINLFYPFPFSLFISAKTPKLAERFKVGVQQVFTSGDAKKLFNRHFQDAESSLMAGRSKLVMIDNPLIDKDENDRIKTRFLKDYGKYFNLLT